MHNQTKLEKVSYGGWDGCYRLSNGRFELIITADVGPRIIRYGFIDGDNILKEYDELRGQRGGDRWVNYGGHRFWHAPEHPVRTYVPDNEPITITPIKNGLIASAAVEVSTGLQKELTVILDPASSQVTVAHQLHNHSLWSIEAAPWALSVMRAGGQGIVVQPPRGSHADNLTPTSALILWAYTDLADPRWTFTERTVRLRQDETATTPQKIGLNTAVGTAAYHWHNLLFTKQIEPQPNAAYPDMGSRVELFTDSSMLEVETLGPLTHIPPDTPVTHTETWTLQEVGTEPLTDEQFLTAVSIP